MIKFFRRIRQQLLTENKFSKYLIYAIGEIVLVVIGILIALQINNWNEERKERKIERKMLIELKGALQRNIDFTNWAISNNEQKQVSNQIILEHFDDGIQYQDSLAKHFSNGITWFNVNLENQAYETLKSVGIHTISNDTIRNMLGILENPWIEIIGERNEQYYFNVVAPTLTDLFESGEMWGNMKPYNYNDLVNSKKYRHILNTLISNRKWQIEFYKEWQVNYLEIIEVINRELDKD